MDSKLISLILIAIGAILLMTALFMALSTNLIPSNSGVYDTKILWGVPFGILGGGFLGGGIVLLLKSKND